MSWFARKKHEYIRWYYGYFVNDPTAETFTFGLHRPYRAMQLSRIIHCLRRWF